MDKSIVEDATLRDDNNKTDIFKNNKKIWNPKWFLPLSIFFSFFPVAIIYSLNYGRLGKVKKRNIYLLSTFVLFIITIILGYFINYGIMKIIFLGLNIGLGLYMKNDQICLYEDHIVNGGKNASYWIPLLICLLFTVLIIFTLSYTSHIPDSMIIVEGDELYYTDSINVEEVEDLGQYLAANEFFVDDNNVISVKIDKTTDKYIFSLVISEVYQDDEEVIEYAKQLSYYLSTEVFNNSKVEVNLCDDMFKPLRKVIR